jgi:hypothetical protein
MPIQRNDIVDEAFESQLLAMLESAGFAPRRENDVIHLTGVGVGRGNSSVDIEMNLVAMDGHRIIEVIAPLRMPPVNFELASLMCTQGNMTSLIAKFKPVEQIDDNAFTVHASIVIYADQIAENELSRMLYLFIKEIDRIDDELFKMISTHKTPTQ